MNLLTLGGLELTGTAIARPKPLLLLAYLALEGSRDRRHLAELFWPDAADPLNSLSAALKQLKHYAPGSVEGSATQVSSPAACDAKAFLQKVEAGRNEEALTLYRGPFLGSVYLTGWSAELEEWVYSTREFLAGRARHLLLFLGEARAGNGNSGEAAKHAERAYLLPGAAQPEPEELTRIHALLVAGNSPYLRTLRQDALSFGLELPASAEAVREGFRRAATPIPRQALPRRSTSFVGRDVERVEIANGFARTDCSLLTLTGPGGVGKSRLAERIAHDLYERLPDGVFFVALEALGDARLVAPTVAGTLGLTLQGSDDPLVQVARYIGDKTMLLVLDNYEHLLAEATLPARLLRACPNLKLLVTSRERLNLEEEWIVALEGLAVPTEPFPAEASHHDAIELFLERAKRARLSFTLTPEELPHVVRICQQVQGLPLGIELAAAWVKLLSCREIAEEIGRTADFLASSSRNVPERHKSIRAVFEGSWRLLSPKEQEVLRKLSVFRGGFVREAAAEVAGATIPVLASLVDKSLLQVADSSRYDLHPLLGQYSREELVTSKTEYEEVHRRYVAYFVSLAEKAEPHLLNAEQTIWLERLEVEQANFRASLHWLERCNEKELQLRLTGALSSFWWQCGLLKEGSSRLATALTGTSAKTAARAKALNGAGLIAWSQALYSRARTLQRENLAIRRALQDKSGTAVALNNLGIIALDEGDYTDARSLHEQSLAIWQALGNKRGVAFSLTNLGLAAHGVSDHPGARTYHEESLALMRELKNEHGAALALINLATVIGEQGDCTLAASLCKQALQLFQNWGDRRGIAFSLEGFAKLSVAQGEVARAAHLWGAASAIRDVIGAPMPPSRRKCYECDLQVARSLIDATMFNVAWQKGRKMNIEQAVAYALHKRYV